MKKISEVFVRFGGGGGRGEEYIKVTWNEGGTEQTDNYTFHHGQGNVKSATRGRIYLCTRE
jgi:hypothetical protein